MTATLQITDVPYKEDRFIWPVLQDLANCLCLELAASDLPELCFCGLQAGSTATDEMGDGSMGQAWVRVVRIYPSASFPAPVSNTASAASARSCDVGLAAEVEVGVMRCAPPPSDDGTVPPTEDEWWEATRLQMADMAAMHRAIRCCASKSDHVELGTYTPSGPAGGVVGGTWQAFLAESTNRRR